MMPNNYQHSEGLVRSSETRKFGITQVEGQLSTEKKENEADVSRFSPSSELRSER